MLILFIRKGYRFKTLKEKSNKMNGTEYCTELVSNPNTQRIIIYASKNSSIQNLLEKFRQKNHR